MLTFEGFYDAQIYVYKKNKYKKEYLYGDGSSGKKIAKILEKVKVKIQKQISY